MSLGRLLRISASGIAMVACACSSVGPSNNPATGGKSGGLGGTSGIGAELGSGGHVGSGGSNESGGTVASGGRADTGGTPGVGGTQGSGGTVATGGSAPAPMGTGGNAESGGASGRDAGRDLPAMGSGGQARGGSGGIAGGSGTGNGGSTPSAGTTTVDCSAAMPTGGQSHSGNSQGGSGNLAWQIWSNQGSGTLTTFSSPAFTAAWNNSGDYLGRLGYEWGNGGKTYDQYGKITADFTFKKNGSAGGFSYIGIYGWSTNPCTEWYIVDDSFGAMPFNPYGSSQKGTATIDGETYKLFSNSTNGTGGSRCNASSWTQHWSVRQKARQCGTITISDHFKAWDAAGMKLGNLLEAKILVETGGGSGSVDFPIAKVGINQ